MIKTIIFDLGGVYFTNGTKRAIGILSSRYDISEEKVSGVLKGDLGTQYRTGAVTAEEFWKRAKEYWDIRVPSDVLANIWFECYEPIQGTVEVIDRLKNADYELIFLSDNVQERVDHLSEKYPFLDKFKDGVFSHIVKIRKPDTKIYQRALEKASHPASECAYIDDKPECLEPAKKLGVRVILFKSPPQLESELEELGVVF